MYRREFPFTVVDAPRIYRFPDFFAGVRKPPDATAALKRDLGLDGARLLVFGGVARAHKGLETFAAAVASMPDSDNWRLLLAGPRNECTDALVRDPAYRGRIHCTGAIPHPDMPKYLALADVLAVPLGTGLMASSQMPCKVYEAMAMEKPVLASAVSDVPAVLDGCGWTVPPGNPAAVAAALREIASDPAEAARRAAAARARAVTEYDSTVAAARLRGLLRPLLA